MSIVASNVEWDHQDGYFTLALGGDGGGGGALSWPLLAPDGDWDAPSYSFASMPDSGIYAGQDFLAFDLFGRSFLSFYWPDYSPDNPNYSARQATLFAGKVMLETGNDAIYIDSDGFQYLSNWAAVNPVLKADWSGVFVNGTLQSNGPVRFAPDNTYDIGAFNGSRPRDVYVAREIRAGGSVFASDVGTYASAAFGLMTGANRRWSLAAAGHFVAAVDNAYDIGALGARPRDVYVGRDVNVQRGLNAQYANLSESAGVALYVAGYANLQGDLHVNGEATVVGRLELSWDPISDMEAATKQYVDARVGESGGGGGALPVGAIFTFAGSTPPAGALVCDGAAVDRTTYAALFAVIGTTYGAGNGSSTFNLPDARGRALIGTSASYALGASGGEASVALATSNLASHNHSGSDGGHSHSVSSTSHAHSVNDSGHTHGIGSTWHAHSIGGTWHGHGVSDPGHGHGWSGFNKQSGGESPQGLIAQAGGYSQGASTGISIAGANGANTASDAANGAATGTNSSGTGVSTAAANGAAGTTGTGYGSISTGSAGSGTAHNNMQPYLAVNYCIQAS